MALASLGRRGVRPRSLLASGVVIWRREEAPLLVARISLTVRRAPASTLLPAARRSLTLKRAFHRLWAAVGGGGRRRREALIDCGHQLELVQLRRTRHTA
eukprot:scaffold222665_cov28-Tisochrysis_lutea.AAC.7